MGNIITFYSFKGGVGRSMSLANVAVLLADWGHRVLIVDWDLEAPGIEHYFRTCLDLEDVAQREGIVDFLHHSANSKYSTSHPVDWRGLLINVPVRDSGIPLHLITAGRRDQHYFRKLRNVDIKRFYNQKGGGDLIESLRKQWKDEYDFVLVDSRTGVTDIGGICTVQLPDTLILLFTATEQSFHGVLDVNDKVREARQKLPFDRLTLASIPIPSRFDSQTEFQISQDWLRRFSTRLSGVYCDWLPTSIDQRKFLEITKIPYISYFSFGEKLPVLEQGTTDPAGLGYAYETLAAMIGNNLESLDQLVEDRDGFLRAARQKPVSSKPSVFISFSHRDKEWKDRLILHLRGIIPNDSIEAWSDEEIRAGHDWYLEVQKAIDETSIAVLLVSADYLSSRFVSDEAIPRLLRRRENDDRVILPVIVKPCAWEKVDWLARVQVYPRNGRPLSLGSQNQIEADMALICEEIANVLELRDPSNDTIETSDGRVFVVVTTDIVTDPALMVAKACRFYLKPQIEKEILFGFQINFFRQFLLRRPMADEQLREYARGEIVVFLEENRGAWTQLNPSESWREPEPNGFVLDLI